MTVYDFIYLLTDDSACIRIYDINHNCDMVYDGEACDCGEFEDWSICSIDSIYECDPMGYFGLNCEK